MAATVDARDSVRDDFNMNAARRENIASYLLAGFFAFLFLYDWITTQPLLHWENFYYMPYLGANDGKGCFHELLKVFNIPAIDAPIARFRPVGHLFELVDAKLVTTLNPAVPLGFRSIMHLILVLCCVPFLAAGLRKLFISWPVAFAWACASFFCAFPQVVVMNSVYFRPVKTLAAFMLAFLFWMWASYRTTTFRDLTTRRFGLLGWCGATLATILLCFGDELCSVVALLFLGLAFFEALASRKLSALFVTMLTAVVVAWAVTKYFAPWTYDHLIASPIDRHWSDLSKGFKYDKLLADESGVAVLYQFSMIFGNSPQYVLRLPLLLALAVFAVLSLDSAAGATNSPLDKRTLLLLRVGLPISVIAVFGTTYLMASFHHPTVTLGSQNTGYYNVPTSLLLYLVLSMTLGAMGVFNSSKNRKIWMVALLACSILGIVSLRPLRALNYPDESPAQKVDFWTLSALVGKITRGQYTPESQWSRLSPGAKYFLSFYEVRVLGKADPEKS
jgi:hypothetical protein